jgi:hypothetical protein
MFSDPPIIIMVAANTIQPVQPVRVSYLCASVIWQTLLKW